MQIRLSQTQRVGLTAVVVSGLMVLLWQPLQRQLTQAMQAYERALALNQMLHTALPEASAAVAEVAAVSATALAGFVARSSAAAGLTVQRMENNVDGATELTLEGRIDVLLAWIEDLNQHSIDLSALTLEVSDSGVASAGMVLISDAPD